MNSHRSVHRKERRFKCEQCDSIAKDRYKLNRHVAVRHIGKCYSCPQCNHQSYTQRNLDVHIDKAHQGGLNWRYGQTDNQGDSPKDVPKENTDTDTLNTEETNETYIVVIQNTEGSNDIQDTENSIIISDIQHVQGTEESNTCPEPMES